MDSAVESVIVITVSMSGKVAASSNPGQRDSGGDACCRKGLKKDEMTARLIAGTNCDNIGDC